MVAIVRFNKMCILLGLILILSVCEIIGENREVQNSGDLSTPFIEILDSTYQEPEEKWLENALRDVAYFLRNHKFNEWDRRYLTKKPLTNSIGFHSVFPIPNLKTIHWEVQKHCHDEFYKCVKYLHSIIVTAPFTRADDISTSLNNHLLKMNSSSLEDKNKECQKAILYSEKTGLPFGGPKEKFKWRTSASYYMCWYTMKGIPALSMLGESCDNFANCLDTTYGNRNFDPRADDKLSFACAMYSFCPDPCCPLKHIKTHSECHHNKDNPCYIENTHSGKVLRRHCGFERKYNQDFDSIKENKWNVSCNTCPETGFNWDPQFSMCVDINECVTKQHDCDLNSQDCLNLPGTFQCICKWDYAYDRNQKKCVKIKLPLITSTEPEEIDKPFNVFKIFSSFFNIF